MGIETALVIGSLVAAGAGAGATAYGAHKQGEAMKDQSREAAKGRAEMEEKMRREEATTAAQDARKRQQQLAGRMRGRRSTILTGPLGIPGGAPVPGSTPVAGGASY